MRKDIGRVPAEPGSRASTEPASSLGPAGFDPSRRLEFRPDMFNDEFDEIVARFADGMCHVETMSDKSCYVGFYWDDGRYCQWWISSKKKLRYHHEDGHSDPPRYSAWGIEQTARDSGSDPKGEDPERSAGAECEASQSGAGTAIAQTLPEDPS